MEFNIRKAYSIAKENSLFEKNERTILAAVSFFSFFAFVFYYNAGFVNGFRGMAYVSIVGLFHAFVMSVASAYMSVSSVRKDMEGKYSYFILKSASRLDYVVGKILAGIAFSLKATIYSMLPFVAFYGLSVGKIDDGVIYVPMFHFLLMATVYSLGTMSAFVLRNVSAGLFAIIGIVSVGHVTYQLKVMIDNGALSFGKVGNRVYEIFYRIFPNFQQFNVRDVIPYDTELGERFLIASAYALILTLAFATVSYVRFKNENL